MTLARTRVAAVALGVLALVGLAGIGTSGAASPGSDPTPSPPATVAPTAPVAAASPVLRVTNQSTYVAPNGVFRLELEIRNAPAGSYLSTTLHRRVRSRAEFTASVAAGKSLDLPGRIATFDTGPEDDLGIPVADISGTNSSRALQSVIPIRVPDGPHRDTPSPRPAGWEAEQTLDEAGVYPVQYRLLDAAGAELARTVTHLVRLPIRAEQPPESAKLRVATVLPLTAPPVLQPDGRRELSAETLDRLTTVTAELTRQADVAVTLDIEPQAIATLATADRRDRTDELDRLRLLANNASDHQILTSTYAGVDATAFTNAGLSNELWRQRAKAVQAVTDQLSGPDASTWAALADLSAAAVTDLRKLAVKQLVVPESSLSPLDERWSDGLYQPFKVASSNGVTTPAVQADRGLRAAFDRTPDAVLNAHQLLAELAVASQEAENPTQSLAGVVVMPPADWEPSAAFLRILLNGLSGDAPLTTTVTVDRLFATIPPAAANGPDADDRGGDLTRMLAPTTAPGLGTYPTQLATQQRRLASLVSIVGPGDGAVSRARDLLDMSGSRVLSATDRSSYVDAAASRLGQQFGQISAPATERVTLTARTARIPMTVTSNLIGTAKVVVQLEGSNRLSFPNGDTLEETLTRGRNRIAVPVRAPTSGDSPLRMRVLSPDGQVVLAETRYTVRSTAVSGVGLVLTIGAFGFLVIWWAHHWRSRRQNGRHAAANRHPTSATATEPEHDPDAPTDPHGVATVGPDPKA